MSGCSTSCEICGTVELLQVGILQCTISKKTPSQFATNYKTSDKEVKNVLM